MRALRRDRITGFVLLAFALVWSLVVWQTIPEGSPGTVGPRAFPLGLGLLLALLSCVLLVRSFGRAAGADTDEDPADSDTAIAGAREALYLRMVGAVFAIIVAYGFLMEKIGFVLATLVIVPAMMMLVLGIRNPRRIAGMALGITFGCWLVFGKMLGAYLPPGTWLSLF